MDGWMGWMGGWMREWMDRWMDWMGGWMDGWMDGWMINRKERETGNGVTSYFFIDTLV